MIAPRCRSVFVAATARLGVRAVLGVCCVGLVACADDGPEPAGQRPVVAELAEGVFAALGEPIPVASEEQRAAFERGREVALRRFTPEQGLGPVFNVAFCGACHESPTVGGSAPRYRDFYLQATVLADGSYLTPDLGGIVHAYGVGNAPDRPTLDPAYPIVGRRNGTPFFGAGLIAELDEEVILANADPDDTDGDGISGRPNYEDGFVGRFGRKAQTTSLEGFIRGPINNHVGITTNPLTEAQRARLPVPSNRDAFDGFGTQDASLRAVGHGQAAAPSSPLIDDDGVPDPELGNDDLFDLVSFVMLLAAPQPDAPTPESERGRVAFEALGCEGCHTPALLGPRGLIPLYSDLLLHDMGEALADGLQMGLATGSEFRTQPLWGVAATRPYLHDGRADTLDAAIRWHGGEALAARQAYEALDGPAQGDVVAFLESLGGLSQRSEGLIPPLAPVPEVGDAGGPDRALTEAELTEWLEGRRLFDADVALAEGLGPLFNGDSCRACHFEPVVGGAGPMGVNVMRHGTLDEVTGGFTTPVGGTIVAKFGVPGLVRPEPTEAHNVLEPRQTPSILGLGALERVPEAEILSREDPLDADGDGISGRAHRLASGALGRFGWKAQVPSLAAFVRDAASAELGLTVSENAGVGFGASVDDDGVPDPELPVESERALAFYLERLAIGVVGPSDPDAARLFAEVGCAGCHTPSLEGPDGPVFAYTDLLLHDVAAADFVGVPDGDASGREFRTPPLWGLGSTSPYLHDGSASTIEAAILAHEGEATASRTAFEALPSSDQGRLLGWLGTR